MSLLLGLQCQQQKFLKGSLIPHITLSLELKWQKYIHALLYNAVAPLDAKLAFLK